MNTKQKLTLGIAAIFMVTLTIVGVTYAYFVTRVNYSTSATAEIYTASLGATFHDGVATYLKDAMPGDKAYHLFAMENDGETDVTYALVLGTYLDYVTGEDGTSTLANPEFVHSTLTDDLTSTCYVSEETATANSKTRSNCYNDTGSGSVYDNLVVRLYRLNSYTGITDDYTYETAPGTIEEFKRIDLSRGGSYEDSDDQTAQETKVANAVTRLLANGYTCLIGDDAACEQTTKDLPYYNGATASMTTLGNAINLDTAETVSAKVSGDTTTGFNYYLLEIEYQNIDLNQNIENEAFVGIKVDTLQSGL